MAYTSVKISASSSDYQSQMKSAAAQMKTLSSEYSVAATKAKLFGSAADSLKAKAETLTQKITVQKDIVKLNSEQQEKLTKKLSDQKTKHEELKIKIEAAKEAYAKSTEETGKNSEQSKALKEELEKLEQEFKANETAIGKTETALANQTAKTNQSKVKLMEMESELENVNKELKNHKLNEFADACDKAGQKMENFGKKMSVVSAGIAGLAAASVKSFTEMKEGYDIIVTKTGATGDALDGLKSSADNVFGDMPEDMATVGEAVGEVNTRFHTTGTELEETSKLFIQFASINGTQVTQSVDQVDKIMKAWNIDASQTGNLLGLLTQIAQDTGISVDSLESYVLDNNAAFKEMGLSLPQAINLMAQFDANGVDTTQALAGLKKALQNATAEGKSMDVALEETIGSIRDAKTDTEALQIATELFGKKGAAEMATAIRENRIDLTSLSASMSEYGSVVETTYSNTKSPMDEAKVAMNNVKLAMSEMGNTLLSSAAPAIGELTSKIKEVTQWFRSLDEGQQQTIIKVGMVVAAVGPLAIGFGKVTQGISSTIKTGQQFVSGVSSIIAKITAKTAATAAGTAADAAGTAATTAHAAATTAATVTTGAMTAAQTALNVAMNLCPAVLIITAIAGLIAIGIKLYKNWDVIKEKASELWGNIKDNFNGIKKDISSAVSIADSITKEKLKNIKKAYEENGGGVKGIVAAGWEGIKGYYSAGFEFIDKLTGGKLTEIKKRFLNSEIGQAASKIFGTVKETTEKHMREAKETVEQNLRNMKTAYEEHGGGVKGIVAAGWEGIKGYYASGFTYVDKLTDGKLSEIKEKFKNKLSELNESVSEKIKNLKESVSEKMEDMGINFSKWDEIKEKVSSAVKATTKTVIDEWNAANISMVASNSKIQEDSASKWKKIKTTVEKAVKDVRSNITSEFGTSEKRTSDVWKRIETDVVARITTAKNSVKKAVDYIRGWMNFENLKEIVSEVWEDIKAKITEPIEKAKEKVENAIKKIQEAFNFEWKLPKLKLPHFKITGSFKLDPPSVPKFNVSWYKTGAIMKSPTIFGINGGNLLGGGEAGDEAILPLEEFYTKLNGMLDRKLEMVQNRQAVYVTNHTYIDGEEVSSRTVSKVDAKMVRNRRKGR